MDIDALWASDSAKIHYNLLIIRVNKEKSVKPRVIRADKTSCHPCTDIRKNSAFSQTY